MNKELQSLLTDLEKFIYQSEKDKFTLDVHQVHLILDHIANQGEKTERSNNIINGMEKFIIYNLDHWNKESSQRSSLIKETLTNTLDTLRELKGNKK